MTSAHIACDSTHNKRCLVEGGVCRLLTGFTCIADIQPMQRKDPRGLPRQVLWKVNLDCAKAEGLAVLVLGSAIRCSSSQIITSADVTI